MDDWQEIVALAASYACLAVLGTLLLGRRLLFHLPRDARLLPLQRSHFISWHGIDVIVAFFILLSIPHLVAETLLKGGVFEWLYGADAEKAIRERGQLVSVALSAPLVFGLVTLGLRQLRGTRASEMGLTPVRAGANITVGFVVWLIVTPVALAIFLVALFLTPEGYAEENSLGRVTEQQLAAWEWTLFFVVAVVMAPVLEELVFRGLLLPWQLHGGWEAQAIVAFCALVVSTLGGVRAEHKPYHVGPVVFVILVLAGIITVLYFWYRKYLLRQFLAALPAETDRAPDRDEHIQEKSTATTETVSAARMAEVQATDFDIAHVVRDPSAGPMQAALAICTNGLLFAAFHSTAWPSPIPLLLVGVALAWVRYRTSSLIGSVSIHALFNAVSAIALFWKQALAS